MNAWEYLDRLPVKLSDALVIAGSTAAFTAWGTYEVVGQTIGYTDAAAVTGLLCCGTPVVAAAGGYRLVRRLRAMPDNTTTARNGRSWLNWWRLLREQVYTPPPAAAEAETTGGDFPDSNPAWMGMVNRVPRSRVPVFPLGQTLRPVGGEDDDAEPTLRPAGLQALDFRQTPHLLITGQTGSGKTKAVLRPLAVMAAISGLFQVVILDRSGRSFRALRHPDIHLAAYNETTLPDLCEAVYGEVQRRDRWLAAHPALPEELSDVRADRRPPRILLIIDEFANTMATLLEEDRRAAGRVNSALIRVAQEGRAMGIHLALVAQRPDANQMNTTLRGQLSGITFQMRDANDARIAQAPGAETLAPGQAIFSHNTGYTTMQMAYPDTTALQQALALATPRQWGHPAWLPESALLSLPNPATRPGNRAHLYPRSPSQGVGNGVSPVTRHPWDLGANGRATSGSDRSDTRDRGDTGDGGDGHHAGYGSGAVGSSATDETGVLPISPAAVTEMLADERASTIDGMTVGQLKLATLCLLSDQSLSATAEAAFGHKNGRYVERVRQVEAWLNSGLERR